MNTEEEIDMKMGWLQWLEFWARFFAWVGAFVLLTDAIWEIIGDSDSPISISLWILPVAAYATGILDMCRLGKKMKGNKPVD